MKLSNLSIVAIVVVLLVSADYANASIIDLFKDEFGRTKWQHVANFSASVLIVLLSIATVALLVSLIKFRKVNRALKEIKRNLEITVKRRTKNLNESNTLLKEANALLEGEIEEHKNTAEQLMFSQNYLYSILESLPSILIGLNEKLEVTHWNKMATEITGLSADSALGTNLWDAYPAITLAPEQIEEVLKTRKPKQIKHSQRGQYYFDINVFPLKGDENAVVVLIDNVTQRTLAENMLIQRDKMASMGELASSMAHDIKIPLDGILVDVEAVSKEIAGAQALSDESKALLVDAVKRGQQASAVIDNLLNFAATKDAEKQSVAPTDLIEHSLRLAKDVLSEPSGIKFRDVVIEKNFGENLPQLHCMVAELQQVFLSIFRHCLRSLHTAKERGLKPTIRVELSESFEALWVRISHNGKGLSAEEQLDLFEPFFNSVSTIKPKPFESENRLSFSHFIVTEQHEGEMAVTSDPESGTTFHIQFRLK